MKTTKDYLKENRLVLRYVLEELYVHRNLLNNILRKEESLMADLTDLTAQVAKNSEVEASAIVLIRGIAAQLAAAATDPVAVAALASQLKSSADALAAAIVENTPAA